MMELSGAFTLSVRIVGVEVVYTYSLSLSSGQLFNMKSTHQFLSFPNLLSFHPSMQFV